MIDKLKTLTESIKNIVLYIIGPLLALFAFVEYEKSHKTTTADVNEQEKVNEKLATEVAKAQDAQKDADNAETNYNTLRDTYLKQQSSASDGAKETTDTTKPNA